MQFIMMIWNGIGGLGAGTVILKATFMLVLGAVFWMLCELAKFTIKVLAKLVEDAFRYLAIMARGWPREGSGADGGVAVGEAERRKIR